MVHGMGKEAAGSSRDVSAETPDAAANIPDHRSKPGRPHDPEGNPIELQPL
jgi:hypothetical protein